MELPDVVTIGSQTAGADGNVSTLKLPGRIVARFSGAGACYPDNTPTQRTGVKIDIVCKPTVKGIREGKDEVLLKAIEYINERFEKK